MELAANRIGKWGVLVASWDTDRKSRPPFRNRRQAILDTDEEGTHVHPASSKDMPRPIIACGMVTPSLECRGRRINVFGATRERLWKILRRKATSGRG
jgi:hypothetical protein